MCDQICPQAISTIKSQLSRHLTDSGELTEISKQFGALNSNSERVDFACKLLQKYGLAANLIKDGKDDSAAVKLRQTGNDMFKQKKLKEAHEFYTKSAACSENMSENLALAYANRSAVLFEVGLVKECLVDIKRALDGNYPDRLISKLLTRQNNCESQQFKAPEEAYDLPPQLSSLNSHIQCGTNAINILATEEMGRHVVAARNIKPGEILAMECPFASVLVDQFCSHCHDCLKLCYNLIPCNKCTQALYCGENCRDRARSSYHQYECPILATERRLELDRLQLLPLKIAILARPFYDKLQNLHLNDKEMYRSDHYEEIHNLVTNEDKRTNSDLFDRATGAAIMFDLVKKHTDFFSNDGDEDSFKELLLRFMQSGPSNFHEISELAADSDGTFDSWEIASGAYAFLSLFNHSCCPNVTRHCHGNTIVVRAIQSIRKGEQCLDNYGYHFATHPKNERQVQLRNQYHFQCQCTACKENWGQYDDLRLVENVGDVDRDVAAKLSVVDLETARTSLRDNLEKLEEAEKYIPCRNFCNLQETVKRCFAVLGNKRRIF